MPTIVLVILVLSVIAGVVLAVIFLTKKEGEATTTEDFPYEKKPYVFDAMTELNLYRTLIELYGDRYYIFPEVGYSKLVQLKPGTENRHRTRFDKKSADFVLCDKERAVARLVIELDGASHNSEKKRERDAYVDRMMQSIGLPIVHIKTSAMDSESIKNQINSVLEEKKVS